MTLALQLASVTSLTPAIKFNSPSATLRASTGTLSLGTSAVLTDGTLADAGGTITGTTASGSANVKIVTKDGTSTSSYITDGAANVSTGAITLSNNEVLTVEGGQIAGGVTVSGEDATPSIIQGYGSFGGDISVGDAKEVVMRWKGPLNVNLDLNAATTNTTKVTLEHDLDFAPGKTFVGAGVGTATDAVYCNGYAVSMGNVSIAEALTIDSARVFLTDATSIVANKAVTFATSGYVNGNSNTLTFGSGATLANGGVAATVANIELAGYSDSLTGAGAWTLNNVTFDNGSERVRVLEGSITGDAAAVLSGATTFGASTVEFLSDLALGTVTTGASTFNGNGFAVTSGTLATGTNAVTLTDMHLKDATVTTSSGVITLSNVLFSNTTSDESVLVTGSFASGTSADPLSGTLTLGDNTIVTMNTNWSPATVTLGDATTIIGKGNKLTSGTIAGGAATTLSDVVVDGATITNGGTLDCHTCSFVNGTQAVTVNGTFATGANPFSGTCEFDDGTNIDLKSDISTDIWQIHDDCVVNGNGYQWDVSTTGSITPYGAFHFKDLVLTNMDANSINGGGPIHLNNVTFVESGGNAVRVSGSPLSTSQTAASISFASDQLVGSGSPTFNNGATVDLLSDCTLGATWALNDHIIVNGNGHVFDIGGGVIRPSSDKHVYLNDITLVDVAAASFDMDAGSNSDLFLNNVTWMDASAGAVRFNASPLVSGQTAAQVSLGSGFADGTDGGLLASNVTFDNGAHITLLSDCALSATWTFSGNSMIEGNGCHLDLGSGVLNVANGVTLQISNAIIDSVVAASIADVTTGIIRLSHCTVLLNDPNTSGTDIDWSSLNTQIHIDNDVTFVVGKKGLSMNSSTHFINGVTAWMDLLGNPDTGIVSGFGGTGRLAQLETTSISVDFTSSYKDLSKTVYLYSADGGISSTVATFTGGVNFTLDGHGRSLVLASSGGLADHTMLSVSGTTEVVTENIVLDGFQPDHFLLATGSDKLKFGHNTVIRLQENWDLFTKTLDFGSDDHATELMEIDLNGYEINFSDGSAAIALSNIAGASGTTLSKLRIKNGRLTNLSGSGKLFASTNGATSPVLVLQNVEMVLNAGADFTWAAGTLEFEGKCKISGIQGAQFLHTSASPLEIKPGSTLTIQDGIIFSYNPLSWTMTDDSCRLELFGATLRHPDASSAALELHKGTLVVDGLSYIQPGLDGIKIGETSAEDAANDVTVEVRPGANLVVNDDGGTTASAGTLTYQNYGG